MTPFQHVLVPVDFGDAMQPAIDLALSLAKRFDASITFVHAFDMTPFVATTPFTPPIDVEPLVASAERALRDVLAKARAEWPKVDAVIRRGPPAEMILDAAKTHACDLILVGTHGRRGIARALLGSVAEKVVRLAPIPVLTVHPPTKAAANAA